MSQLRQLLTDKRFILLTYLIDETQSFAELAQKSGADAVILKGESSIEDVARGLKIPLGFDCLDEKCLDSSDFSKNKKLLDFVNVMPHKMPASMVWGKVSKVITLDENFSLEQLLYLKEKGIDALDAAILSRSGGKNELMVGDLQQYITICISSGLPVIVPTQRQIRPSEVPIIEDAGARGLILTEAVLGKNERSFEKAIKEFRIAVDDLG